MNTFALEIFDDEGSLCTMYTVRWDEAVNSETDKFFQKFNADEAFKRQVQELAKFLEVVIGNKHGALEAFFRFENTAHALPPPGEHTIETLTIDFSNFPLRLYCLRLSDSLIVLFNGGEKTGSTAQSGKTSMAFLEANQFAKRILEGLKQKDIYIDSDGRTIKNYDGSNEILL